MRRLLQHPGERLGAGLRQQREGVKQVSFWILKVESQETT